MRLMSFFSGFALGLVVGFNVIYVAKLIVGWVRERKERKRGYTIDVYEPEPMTPIKKH